jgi:crotonobetainyl-CoA:carnitine CoA-transferase CaiB-like acyl-CoA transferase
MLPEPEKPTAGGSAARGLPLKGVTVLDLGQIYNGPYASFLMAMSGARVIKIEPPEGENMRRRAAVGPGAMLPFAMLNSNKEFVSLNLKTEAGKAVFLKMVAKADIVIENFAPGVMDRLGVGPDRLMQINPRLVYAAGTGYGSTGPYRNYLAMDLTVQAMSGVMACTGFPDRPPVKSGAALCDFFGAVHLYGAAVAALFDAQRTGVGRFVEVAMLEAVYPTLSSALGLYHGMGNRNPPRTGNRHNGLAESPYNVYPAKDGWIALFCVNEAHFKSLATAMARPELPADPRFVDHKARVANMDELDAQIGAWTINKTKSELQELAARHRVPCAPVRELDEVVNDPHMHERGTLRRVVHPELGEVVLPTGPLRYADSAPPDFSPSKSIGADGATVLRDWLGLSSAEYDALVAGGAV